MLMMDFYGGWVGQGNTQVTKDMLVYSIMDDGFVSCFASISSYENILSLHTAETLNRHHNLLSNSSI